MFRCKVHRRTVEKILKNQTQILTKLDTIDSRMLKIEKALDNNKNNNDSIDSDDVKVIEMYIINQA